LGKRSRYIRILSHTFLLVWICAAAFGLEEGNSAPVPLILSPVNATWAANNAAYWREKGFGGFLLTGIVENAAAPGQDTATTSADPNKPLIREVRLANERLAESGLGYNFVYLRPVREEDRFVSTEAGVGLVDRMRLAGSLCVATGLQGIAFDTCSSSGFYDYAWDGYAYGAYTPADLASNARRLGRSVARAVLHEQPKSEFLLITDGWPYSGPLWLPFFEGVLEGAAMDDACRVRLLTRESFTAQTPADLVRVARETRAALEQRLEPRRRAVWKRQGSLCLGLAPLAYDAAGQPVAAVSPREFRSLVAATKALSDGCMWVESQGSCWWRLDEQDVETYSQLLQNGADVPNQARPIVPNLAAYGLRMPYDSWRRAGPLQEYGVSGDVYSTAEGAALVLWPGVPRGVTLPAAGQPFRAKNLADGTPIDGRVESNSFAVPHCVEPVLVEGLPAWPWLVRAGLRVKVTEPPAPNGPLARLSYEFQNATSFDITGTLSFLPPAGYSANPEAVPMQLAPGQYLRGSVNLSGDFAPGNTGQLKVGMAVQGGGVLTQTVEVRAVPRELWTCGLDGDAAGNLLVTDLDGSGPRELVACTSAGEIACIDIKNGALTWKRRFTSSFKTKPVAGLIATGEAAIAVIDDRGRLRVLNRAGEVVWERNAGRAALPPVFADVDAFAGEEIVLPHSNGQILALGAGGQEIWRYNPPLEISWFGSTRGPDRKPVLVALQKRPVRLIAALNSTGRLLWSSLPEAAIAGTPWFADANSDGSKDLVAVTETGLILAWDLANGECIARHESRSNNSAAMAAAGPGLTVPPVELEFGRVGAVAFDAKGRELWRIDDGPSITGLPLVADVDGSGHIVCICSDSSRSIRALDLETN